MQRAMAAPLTLALLALAISAPHVAATGSVKRATTTTKVTPVAKVLEMLNGMLNKGIAEMEAEQKIYAEYAEWVDDQKRELGFQSKTLTTEIGELTDFIDETENTVSTVTSKIADLDSQIATLEAD